MSCQLEQQPDALRSVDVVVDHENAHRLLRRRARQGRGGRSLRSFSVRESEGEIKSDIRRRSGGSARNTEHVLEQMLEVGDLTLHHPPGAVRLIAPASGE